MAPTPPPVVLVEDLEVVLSLLAREEAVGFDPETTGLDPHMNRVRLVSFYLTSKGKAVVIDLRLGEGVLDKLFSKVWPAGRRSTPSWLCMTSWW